MYNTARIQAAFELEMEQYDMDSQEFEIHDLDLDDATEL